METNGDSSGNVYPLFGKRFRKNIIKTNTIYYKLRENYFTILNILI